MEQQHASCIYTLVITRLQYWLELPGFVLTRSRFPV